MWGLNDVLTYSIAYGMGEEEGRAKAEREKKASSNWHTGTPTEEGWYLVAFNYEDEEGIRYTTDYFKDGKWAFPMVRDISKVVKWQKIDED